MPTGHPTAGTAATVDGEKLSSAGEEEEWVGEGCCFLKFLYDHLLAVDEDGIIQVLQPAKDDLSLVAKLQPNVLAKHEFLCPGLIDLHIHAAQFSYTGTATDRTLFDWLEHYTFPAERQLQDDLDWARKLYRNVVSTTLSYGTTTAVYHTTLHVEPCKILVDTALELGQRAIIGKVSMDRNSPDDYVHSTEQNVAESIELIEYIQANDQSLVLPMVTPRFIPTCSPTLLDELAQVVKKYGCYISTHISEGKEEVAYTQSCDAKDHGGSGRTGTQILQSHGLLSDKCVLAHCVHIDDADAETLRNFGSCIAHCPLSNFYFAKGTFSCKRLLQAGNRIGLGTDVAGGYSPSLWVTQRDTVLASRCLANHKDASASLDYRHAFWLATLGGAQALGLDDKIGTFAVGMEFDAIVISPDDSPIFCYPSDTTVDVFQKVCVLGDDRNVKRVFVQGREVKRM